MTSSLMPVTTTRVATCPARLASVVPERAALPDTGRLGPDASNAGAVSIVMASA